MEWMRSRLKGQAWGALVFLLVLGASYVTYFENYSYPPNLFWDENYHIASAQKYLNGIHFMEPHPPLGKLLIAAGEKLLKVNPRDDQFIGTMYIKNEKLPDGFSFSGYRFFPALLGWLTAPILFLVFYRLTRGVFSAGLLSCLYVFDNALIVHTRGAMLEGPQLFFMAAFLLAYLILSEGGDRKRGFIPISLLSGVLFGCVAAVKINGLVLSLLIPALLFKFWPRWQKWVVFASCFTVGAAALWLAVWQVHFSLAVKVNPTLENQGYFAASPAYRRILAGEQRMSWRSLPVMFADSYAFLKRYENGVPKLNLCKADETGSPSFMWPLGGRAIKYRWEKAGQLAVRYLYLQANPVVWLLGLSGVLLAASLLAAAVLYPAAVKLRNPFGLSMFSLLYFSYMFVMARLERVMYLYHYFIPLLFSFLLFALVWVELEQVGFLRLTLRRKQILLALCSLLTIISFYFYAPLTYYEPITGADFKHRALASIWDLSCVGCPQSNLIAQNIPCKIPQKIEADHMKIAGLSPAYVSQGWGEPVFGKTVEGKDAVVAGRKYENTLGVHAESSLKYALKKEYKSFRVWAGLPDYLQGQGGSVVFQLFADGKKRWDSGVMEAGSAPKEAAIDVAGMAELELRVTDGGDGLDYDHACWLDPELSK